MAMGQREQENSLWAVRDSETACHTMVDAPDTRDSHAQQPPFGKGPVTDAAVSSSGRLIKFQGFFFFKFMLC